MRTTIIKRKEHWCKLVPRCTDERLARKVPSLLISEDSVLFGRDYTSCHKVFPIEFLGVSGRHFELLRTARGAILNDMSRNGTKVGQDFVKHQRVNLSHGDLVSVAISSNIFFDMTFNFCYFEDTELTKKYTVIDVIGKGHFSSVYRAVDKNTGTSFALKQLDPNDFSSQKRELDILTRLDHPNIVKLYEVVEKPDKYTFFVFELCQEGDLLNLLDKAGPFSEQTTGFIFYQIVSALCYLHDQKIAHRDLKPENILISKFHPIFPEVKLTDFGLSRVVETHYSALTACGTPQYAAPEIVMRALQSQKNSNSAETNVETPQLVMKLQSEDISSGYGTACDMWSLGIVLVFMLTRVLPNLNQTSVEQYLQQSFWKDCSKELPELISSLLQVIPRDRISAQETIEHSWVSKWKNADLSLKKKRALSVEEDTRNTKRQKITSEVSFIANRLENVDTN